MMKKIYVFLMAMAFTYSAFAQLQQSIWIDYSYADAKYQIEQGNKYMQYPYFMNGRYNAPSSCSGLAKYTTNYFIVAFNTLVDTNGIVYTNSKNELMVDSIQLLLGHENNSGNNDTLMVKILSVDGNGYPTSTKLWDTTIVKKNFLASNDVNTFGLFSIAANYKVQNATKFAVRVDYYADKQDSLVYIAGAGYYNHSSMQGTCVPQEAMAIQSLYSSNSLAYLPCINSLTIDATGKYKTFRDCNQNGTYDGIGTDGAPYIQNILFYVKISAPLGITERKAVDGTILHQNQPNPFNKTSVITYELAKGAKVSLEIYDITGRKLSVVNEGHKSAGKYNITLDAGQYAKGIYFYTLKANDVSLTQRMVITE